MSDTPESGILMAEALAQSMVEEGVQRARDQLPKQPADFNGLCDDCGDEIPVARIKFGAITCVSCQALRERKASLIRRP